MPNFLEGKIYKILCPDNYFYIGSTCQSLQRRLWNHKCTCKGKLKSHIDKIGWDNIKIVLLEEYSCNSRQELFKKETEYIEKYIENKFCLNMNMSVASEERKRLTQIKSSSRYNEKNKEKYSEYQKEYHKKYREQNRERLIQYNKDYREKNKNL